MPSPSDPRRFRKWFLLAASAVLAAAVIAFIYNKAGQRGPAPHVARQLSGRVERATEGFSLSKSEGGRTLFTIHAAHAIEYKEGKPAHLQDVNIVMYGKSGDRFDQISGPDFEYDPQSGDVAAHGPVEIDLEANPGGAQHPDQQPPREQKNLIHIKTSEMRFNQKTGLAQTKQAIEFRLPQATGTALGARMDSQAGILTLERQVEIDTKGDHPAHISGESGTLSRNPRQAVIEHAHVTQPEREFSADRTTAFFDQQNQVQRMVAEGNVTSTSETPAGEHYVAHAPQQEFVFSEKGKLRTSTLHDGVTLQANGPRPAHGSAHEAQIDFDAEQHVSKIHGQGDVHLAEDPATKGGQAYELIADAVDLFATAGHIARGETAGAARIELRPQATAQDPEPGKTVVTAGKFDARFDNEGRLKMMHGEPDAKIVSPNPEYGEPDRVSTSRAVEATFNSNGQVQAMTQTGSVHYNDGERQAFGDQGRYTPHDQMLVLTGSPRVMDEDGNTTADVIRMNRATNQAFAQGTVKSTYLNSKPNPNGSMLGSASPVHVTAESMTAAKATGAATYTGHARLWQDANIIQAPQIELLNNERKMEAESKDGKPVQSVLVQSSTKDPNHKQAPVNITSDHFVYTDDDRVARYEGHVLMTSEDGTLTAQRLDVYLKPRSETQSSVKPAANAAASAQPSQIDHAVATGKVALTQPGRRGTGEKLVYTDSDQKFVLTGTENEQPQVTDVQHGITRGDRLIFFRGADNRVLVESTGVERAYTQTRVK